MIKKNFFSIIVALVILFLSFTGQETFEEFNIPKIPYLDKIVHLGMYFVLMLTLIIENRLWLTSIKKCFILAAIPVFYGSVIEILQPLLTKSRTGDFYDACFNTLGVIFAIFVWVIIKHFRNQEIK